MAKAGLREANGERTRINGLDAYVGTYEGVSGNTRIGVRAAYIRAGQQTYLFAGLSSVNEFSRVQGQFATAIQSFRALSAEEADRIQPSRVDFVVARQGDTWESIAEQSGGAVKASTLAIMNGQDPTSGRARAPGPRRRGRVRFEQSRQIQSMGLVLGARVSSAWRRCSLAAVGYTWVTLPDVRPLRTERPASTAFMRLRADEARAAGKPVRQSQRWVPYSRIRPTLVRAVLVTEDAAFWSHDGIDYDELRAAFSTRCTRARRCAAPRRSRSSSRRTSTSRRRAILIER